MRQFQLFMLSLDAPAYRNTPPSTSLLISERHGLSSTRLNQRAALPRLTSLDVACILFFSIILDDSFHVPAVLSERAVPRLEEARTWGDGRIRPSPSTPGTRSVLNCSEGESRRARIGRSAPLGGARLGSVAPRSEPGEGAHRRHCGEHGHGGHTRKVRSRVRGLQGTRAFG